MGEKVSGDQRSGCADQESRQDFAESYPDMRPEETCPGSRNKTLCDSGRGRKNEGGIIAEPDSKLPEAQSAEDRQRRDELRYVEFAV